MLTVEQEQYRNALLKERDDLVNSKKDHEVKLVAIKNLVRSSGRMEHSKYKQCCDSQQRHLNAIRSIENELAKLKVRLREIGVESFSETERANSRNGEEVMIVQELVALRSDYQAFAADSTRVSSMRTMAAEFVVRLSGVIRRAVNGSSNTPNQC